MDKDTCPICLQNIESVSHALCDCETFKDVSGQSNRKIQNMSHHNLSFLDLWNNLTGYLNQMELAKAAYISNFIWARRNDNVHNKEFVHPNSIIVKARNELNIFYAVQPAIAPAALYPKISHLLINGRNHQLIYARIIGM